MQKSSAAALLENYLPPKLLPRVSTRQTVLHGNPPPFPTTPPTAREDVLSELPHFIEAERTDTASEAGKLEVWVTTSRGLAHLSGVGDFDMFDEMRSVMACGEVVSFTFNRPPKRQIVDE